MTIQAFIRIYAILILALVIVSAAAFRQSRHARRKFAVRFFWTSIWSSFLFAFGTELQQWIQDLTSPGQPDTSPIYLLQYETGRYVWALWTMSWPFGLTSGILTAFLLTYSRFGASPKQAIKATVAVLIGVDLWYLLSTLVFGSNFERDAALSQAFFSIGNDIVGGCLGGWICWWFFDRVKIAQESTHWGAIKAIQAASTIILAAFASFILIYYLIIRRVPNEVALLIRSYHKLSVSFGLRHTVVRPGNEYWIAQVSDVSISSIGYPPITVAFGKNVKDGVVSVIRVEGCPSATDAYAAAVGAKGAVTSIATKDLILSDEGISPTIHFISDGDPSTSQVAMSIPWGAPVTLSPSLGSEGATISFFNIPTVADISIQKGAFVFGAAKIGGKLSTQYGTGVKSEVRTTSGSQIACGARIRKRSPEGSLNLQELFADMDKVYFVIRAIGDNSAISMQVQMNGLTLHVPKSFSVAQADPGTTHASLISADVDEGVVSLGQRKYPLDKSDKIFIAGDDLRLFEYSDGSVSVSGSTAFTALNSQVLNNSIFSDLPVEIQIFFLAGPFGLTALLSQAWIKRQIKGEIDRLFGRE